MGDPINQAKSIFLAAIENHEPAERPAFLDNACNGDAKLRAEVEKLLQAHAEIGSFHEESRRSSLAKVDDPVRERPGTVIGPYKLLEQIGEGGMGLVFVAEQQQPVRRRVALKVIKPGMDSRQVIARFEAERQALALMDHPHIAKVHDGGTTPEGRPYFIMELVKGMPITDYCDKHRLTNRQRLQLFLDVCHAVQHAHQKGIIHRDLKPSNVLVEIHDVRPVVKVIDFGIAKAMGQQLTDKSVYTGIAQMMGTPLYMSPEQAGFSSLDVDTRSDVYSLGVLLYELLTGTTPFHRQMKQVDYDEMRRIVREEEPPRPSTLLSTMQQAEVSTIAEKRGIEPRRLSQQLRGELDWIVMKALEKDRNRRYESASAFAADVQRYLADEPVHACPPSKLYRLRKFVRRHSRVASAGTAILVVAAALVAGLQHLSRLQSDEEIKQRRVTYDRRIAESQLALERRDYGAFAEIMKGLRPQAPPDLRGFEWYYLWDQYRTTGILAGHTANIDTVAYSPDGRTLLTTSWDTTARLWDPATGLSRQVLAGHTGHVQRAAISPDGRTVATTSIDTTIRLWDVASGKMTAILSEHTGTTTCVAFSPDGRTLAVGGEDKSVSLWDTATARLRLRCIGHLQPVCSVVFTPDGQLVVSGSQDETIRLWDAATGKLRRLVPTPGYHPWQLTFFPDNRLLASHSGDTFRIWDTTSWQILATRRGPAGFLTSLALSADGRTLAVSGGDYPEVTTGAVRLWDVAQLLAEGRTHQPPQLESVHTAAGDHGESVLHSVALDASGNRYVTGHIHGTVELGRRNSHEVVKAAGKRDIFVAKYSPSDELLWTRTLNGAPISVGRNIVVDRAGRIWVVGYLEGKVDFDPGHGLERLTSPGPRSGVLLQLSTDGDLRTAQLVGGSGELCSNTNAALGPEGDLYLTGSFSGRIECDRGPGVVSLASAHRWDGFVARYTVRGDCVWARQFGGSNEIPHSGLAVSPDGNILITGTFEQQATFGPTVLTAPSFGSYVAKLSPSGSFLWARTFGENTIAVCNAIATNAAGHIYIAGDHRDRPIIGDPQMDPINTHGAFVARLDERGTPLWMQSVGGLGEKHAFCLTLDGAGHVYVGGHFTHRVDFDPGNGGDVREGRSAQDPNAFLWKLDEDGNSRGVWTVDSTGLSQTLGLACDARHQIHAVGHTSGDSRVLNRTIKTPQLFLARFQPAAAEAARAYIQQTTNGFTAVAFAPNGQTLALGDRKGQVRLWQPAPTSPPPAAMSHGPEEAWAVALSPDGSRLISGGDNEKVPTNLKAWDVASGQSVWTASKHTALVSCVAYSPDGTLIAAGDYDNTIRLWGAADGKEVAVLAGHTGALRCLAFSPGGRLLASGAQDHTIRLWDTASARLLQTLIGHTNNVRGLIFTLDGRRLVSTGTDSTVRIWDAASGRCERTWTDSTGLLCLALSPDGKELYAGARDGRIRQWELATGQERLGLLGHPKEVRALALTPDGRTLASAGEDGAIVLWDTATGQQLLTLRGHERPVNGLAFSPRGDLLISACHDGTIGQWRAPRE